MSEVGQYYINEHDELGVITDYAGSDKIAVVAWYRRNDKGKRVFKNQELRYLPYLIPITKEVADIMIGSIE